MAIYLALTSANDKVHRLHMHLKVFVKTLGIWPHVAKKTYSWAPQRLGDKAHPTLGIAIF